MTTQATSATKRNTTKRTSNRAQHTQQSNKPHHRQRAEARKRDNTRSRRGDKEHAREQTRSRTAETRRTQSPKQPTEKGSAAGSNPRKRGRHDKRTFALFLCPAGTHRAKDIRRVERSRLYSPQRTKGDFALGQTEEARHRKGSSRQR